MVSGDPQICEIGLTAFFSVECLVRVCALGVRGYFRQGWNRLDFLIVITALVDFLPGVDSGPLSVLRTMRVLRPLRVVNRFPSLRILVHLLLDIIPMLGSVMVLCSFLFLTFGIVGVQLWKGVFRNGCYSDDDVLYKPLPRAYYICSFVDGQSCPAPEATGGVAYTCEQRGPNYHNGDVSFDNIGKALIAVFQVRGVLFVTGHTHALTTPPCPSDMQHEGGMVQLCSGPPSVF